MTVLCAVDFSAPSVAAAEVAAALAARFGDGVVLLHALEVVVPPGMGESAAVVQDFVSAQQVAAREALDNVAATLRKAFSVSVETRLDLGPAPRVIREAAAPAEVRLVVLASHGRGALERAVMGSVADRVSRESDKALLVVGSNAAELRDAIGAPAPLRVTVGVDLGPASEAALTLLREWRGAKDMDLTLVHAFWPPGEAARLGLQGAADLYQSDPEVVAVLMRELREKVGVLPGQGALKWLVQPSMGRPADRVMDAAAADGAHLVWMGTSSPKGLRRLLPGSNALQLLHGWTGSAVIVPERYRGEPHAEARGALPDFRAFLCVTDFSPLGNQAVLAALSLARVRGGVVHAVHVTDGAVQPEWSMDRTVAVHADHRHLVEKLRNVVAGANAHVSVHIHVVAAPDAAVAILQAVERLGVDLVVTGHHGKTPAVEVMMGSVAQRLISKCSRPVLVVRG